MKEFLYFGRFLFRPLHPKYLIKSFIQTFQGWYRFWKSYKTYSTLEKFSQTEILMNLFPCIGDDTISTPIEPIYFYQDAWAFELIVNNKPDHHIDIGSHHKYVALLSKVVPLTFVDIRPLSLPMKSIEFKKGSILDLPFSDNSISSMSCLCVVEHIGLGRYGDPLDPDGSIKSIRELIRVLKPGGNLYFSVPIQENNTIYFNAHRAFSEESLLELFKPAIILEKRYIYQNSFQESRSKGFGTGLYHIQKRNIS